MAASSESSNRVLAGAADALLAFFPVLAAVHGLSLPLVSGSSGIVSATTRAGFEPLTNYVQFGLCSAATWGMFALGYRRGNALVATVPARIAALSSASTVYRAVLALLAGVAVLIYVVNVTSFPIVGAVEDGFHEGEYLGFIPALEANGARAIGSTVTVHGPGVDFIPGAAAIRFADAGHRIVVTRFAYGTLHVCAVLAALLIIAIASRMLLSGVRTLTWLCSTAVAFLGFTAMLQIGDWTTLPVFDRSANPRDLGYLMQVAVVLAFAAAQTMSRKPALPVALATVAGLSLPWAIAYSYDRGLYGVFLIGTSSIVFGLGGGSRARRWFGGAVVGVAAGCASMFAIFGGNGIAAMISQLAFWTKYGRPIWSYAGLQAEPHSLSAILLAGGLVSIAIGMAQIIRSIAATRDLRVALGDQSVMACLVVASLPGLRTAVERGDTGHVAWGVTISWILLSVLLARVATFAVDRSQDDAANAVSRIAISLLLGWCLVQASPTAAYERLRNLYSGLRVADSEILSREQSDVAHVLRLEAGSAKCFYTLTNEGFLYYLADKPSCSGFYQVTNARALNAQKQVIAELHASSPPLIVFSDTGWSNVVDGVSLFNGNPQVAQYVMRHYVPYKVVGEHWLWKRTDDVRRFAGNPSGEITESAKVAHSDADIVLAGTYGSAFGAAPPVALFLTDGSDNSPVWAGRPVREAFAAGRWSVTVPTASLGRGAHRLRAWALRGDAQTVTQLGHDVDIDIR